MSSIPERLPGWWRQPDHFEWFSNYLLVRRMAARTRAAMVAVTVVLAIVVLTTLFSSSPPTGPVNTVLALLSGLGAAAGAVLWIIHFPSRRQSLAFALVSSVSIAMAAISQSHPVAAILACTTFASLSGYLALFHSAPQVTANLVVALGASVHPILAFAASDGVVLALSAYGVLVVVNVAVPFVVQVVVHAMGADVLRADRDPLTGLYTRRAFYRRALGLVAEAGGDGQLAMAMIDLDKFKQLNDSHGHAEGDRVLAAVGRILQEHARPSAIIGRLGGEEFIVADVMPESELVLFGNHFCDAIAALPHRITASVGTVVVPSDALPRGDDLAPVIAEMAEAADGAMYVAKRNGGNRSRQHRADPPGRGGRVWNEVDKRWETKSGAAGPRKEIRSAPSPTRPQDGRDDDAPTAALRTPPRRSPVATGRDVDRSGRPHPVLIG